MSFADSVCNHILKDSIKEDIKASGIKRYCYALVEVLPQLNSKKIDTEDFAEKLDEFFNEYFDREL